MRTTLHRLGEILCIFAIVAIITSPFLSIIYLTEQFESKPHPQVQYKFDAHSNGYEAAIYDIPAQANPYTTESGRIEWLEGWMKYHKDNT